MRRSKLQIPLESVEVESNRMMFAADDCENIAAALMLEKEI